MRRLASTLRNLFGNRTVGRSIPRRRETRLWLEPLEDRALLSGMGATITGVAYVDSNANGVRDASEVGLSGQTITLTGTTSAGNAVNLSTATDGGGGFFFLNLLPGTYNVSIGAIPGLLSDPAATSPPITITDSETVTEDLAFGGLAPQLISARQFLSETNPSNFPGLLQTPGTGTTSANHAPFVKVPIGTITGTAGGNTVDLAGFFSDPDITNSFVRFDTSAGPINVELFDQQAPQTVANFLDYISSGAYNNLAFSRLAINRDGSKFVLQGGQYSFGTNPDGSGALASIPILGLLGGGLTSNVVGVGSVGTPDGSGNVTPGAPSQVVGQGIPNEFTQPGLETLGTLAMAKVGNEPNSATNQFFFNLNNNSTNLDNQNGGFTVFGKVVGPADLQVLNNLVAQGTPTAVTFKDTSGASQSQDSFPLNGVPANDPKFPADTTAANYELINNAVVVSQGDSLTYSVVNNNNPNLVTATVVDNYLQLKYTPGQKGLATITVQATDQFGAVAATSFTVNVP